MRRFFCFVVFLIVAISYFLSANANIIKISGTGQASSNSSDFEDSSNDLEVNQDKWKDQWNLLLVNRSHTVPDNFQVTFRNLDQKNKLDERCADYYLQMLEAAKKDGIKLYTVSCYRSYAEQALLYKNAEQDVNANAGSNALSFVAPPGNSEHHTGLAVDVVNDGWYLNHSKLTSDFDKTDAFKWLTEHCADYGFILRYQKDKVDITKYQYEPWHFRYVGVDHAKEITRRGICLEEYLGILD